MDPHPLDGAWTKLDWAAKQLDELETDIAQHGFDSTAVSFRSEYQPDKSRVVSFIESVSLVREEWALTAHNIINDLRAALNYCTWELAKWNLEQTHQSRVPDGQTQFPLARTANEFNRGFVKDLHPDHVAIIEFLQPYGPANMVRYSDDVRARVPLKVLTAHHPLSLLANLSNTDKHKVLRRTAVAAQVAVIGHYVAVDCEIVGSPNYFVQIDLKPGAEWAIFPVKNAGSDPRVEVQDHVVTQVSFEGGYAIGGALHGIGNAITQHLGFFEPVFEAGVRAGKYAAPVRAIPE